MFAVVGLALCLTDQQYDAYGGGQLAAAQGQVTSARGAGLAHPESLTVYAVGTTATLVTDLAAVSGPVFDEAGLAEYFSEGGGGAWECSPAGTDPPAGRRWLASPAQCECTGTQAFSPAGGGASVYVTRHMAGSWRAAYPSITPPAPADSAEELPASPLVANTCPPAPQSPPASPPSPSFETITVYRVQGANWVQNIANADVADAAGQACYLERFTGAQAPDSVYPSPVVASYTVEFSMHYDNYSMCNPPKDGEGKATAALPRTCDQTQAKGLKVGKGPCLPTTGAGFGTWYSVQWAGECHLGDETGLGCAWKVTGIGRVVDLTCLRQEGCLQGSCSELDFTNAFAACDDVSAPMCTTCPHPPASDDMTKTMLCDQQGRMNFSPDECIECIQLGASFFWLASDSGSWSCSASKHVMGKATLTDTAQCRVQYTGASTSSAAPQPLSDPELDNCGCDPPCNPDFDKYCQAAASLTADTCVSGCMADSAPMTTCCKAVCCAGSPPAPCKHQGESCDMDTKGACCPPYDCIRSGSMDEGHCDVASPPNGDGDSRVEDAIVQPDIKSTAAGVPDPGECIFPPGGLPAGESCTLKACCTSDGLGCSDEVNPTCKPCESFACDEYAICQGCFRGCTCKPGAKACSPAW